MSAGEVDPRLVEVVLDKLPTSRAWPGSQPGATRYTIRVDGLSISPFAAWPDREVLAQRIAAAVWEWLSEDDPAPELSPEHFANVGDLS